MSRLSMSDSETASTEGETLHRDRVSSRAMIVETLKGWGTRVVKEELRRKIVIPAYLCAAVVEAMRLGDPYGAMAMAEMEYRDELVEEDAPEAPMVVFINARSGGRHGPMLKARLQELIGEEQVFDLADVKPSDFVEYGLVCLEKLADHGDYCARATRERMRIMVAGGDGTVGWVLHSLGELSAQNREPVPPIGIIPLGTGNDLSRSFGWGGSFSFAWKSAVKRCLNRAVNGPICRLDSWRVVVSMPAEETVDLPHSLRHVRGSTFDQDWDIERELPEEVSCFGGDFYNYFSIGMDAQVTYGFHQLRDEKPYLAQGPITNKLIYTGYSCAQGWFFTSCMSDPSLKGLKNILRIHIKKFDCSEWEKIQVPSSVRAVVVLNLHNYGSGRNPWGNLKPGYLMKRGFVEAQADDGLLEIFGLKQGWHASAVMVELVPAKHIAQASAIRLEIRGGQWNYAYMQMDGEPWKQPIRRENSTFIEIQRVPYQSLLIRGE